MQARATDDSLNTGPPATLELSTESTDCPCQLFGNGTPKTVDSGDAAGYELGVRFSASIDGWVTGVRFHKAPANTGVHVGSLWNASGALLAQGTFTGESAAGWQNLEFPAPVPVTAGTAYFASYSTTAGHYSLDADLLRAEYSSPPLTAPASGVSAPNGVYGAVGAFPTSHVAAHSYGVDVVFTDVDTHPPAVVASDPVNGASSVPVTHYPAVVLSEPIEEASLQLSLSTSAGTSVAGSASYDATTRTATFVPDQPLANDTPYHLTVSAADVLGNAMTPT